MNEYYLDRFIKAQEINYKTALTEIKSGKKQSHWMWYIFPQIKGLGYSETAKYYAIENLEEARAYLNNKFLYNNLTQICNELLNIESNDIVEIMGYIDSLKLSSSMTLFYFADSNNDIFKQVLEKYYDGRFDERTKNIIEGQVE